MSDRYNDPDTGIAEFNGRIADVLDALEVDVEYRDDDSNRNDYTPTVNAKFTAEDTGAVYIGNGSDWIHIPTTGDEPDFAAASVEGDHVVVGDSTYRIEKDGTDGVGVINFKTEE